MKYQFIAAIKDRGKIIKYRIVETEKWIVRDVELATVVNTLVSQPDSIKGLELRNNEICGSCGVIDKYPIIARTKIENKNAAIIISKNETGNEVTYTICNYEAKKLIVKCKDLIDYAENGTITLANAKIVTTNGTKYIASKLGVFDTETQEQKRETKAESKQEAKAEVKAEAKKESNDSNKIASSIVNGMSKVEEKRRKRTINGTQVNQEELKKLDTKVPIKTIDENGNEKMVYITIEQKFTKALMSLKKAKPFYYSVLVAMGNIPTYEVPTMGVSINKLYWNPNFVCEIGIEEIIFILMHEVMHVVMKHNVRAGNRDHDIWNRACDFYINTLLIHELGLKNPGDRTDIVANNSRIGICAEPHGLYTDMTPDELKDMTPEKIYTELQSLIQQVQKMMQGQGQGQGQQGNGQTDKNPKLSDLNNATYRGQKMGNNNDNGLNDSDLVMDKSSKNTTPERAGQMADALLRRAVTIHKMNNRQFGGDQADAIERIVELALAPKINWKQVLKSKLVAASRKVNSFSSPDRRFIGRNIILPGPRMAEPDALKGVKICIDISDSISDEDLGVALAQVAQLLKIYKAEAELLYWDTRVRATYEFDNDNFKDMLKKKPAGGGGTDANCIFSYFETNKEYKRGKKVKPSIIIVFTDGYFGEVNKSYGKKYRDTIWVIQKDCVNSFKAPFGIMAPMSIND